MKETILSYLPTECPWGDTLYWFDTIDSTNIRAKEMAKSGAPNGTVLVAEQQTQGKGRLGRSFHSPADSGIYMSVILRPSCPPQELMHLTCAAAVAMCDAVEAAAGIRPGIKWTNDLVIGERKLGGILTELSVEPDSGLVEYAIVGIGINCCQELSDFPEELLDMVTSLKMATGKSPSREKLAAEMLKALWQMDLSKKECLMDQYRRDCITVGKDIRIIRGDTIRHGTALSVDDDGALSVRFSDGAVASVNSGEVSIRGMYGYTD